MDNINKSGILNFINSQPIKAVESIDLDNDTVTYSSKIISPRNLEVLPGGEEVVRSIILTKLVNEYGYPLERIELEKTYEIGRPKVINPRIDVIVKDENDNAFLYIELKSPDEFENDQDEIIEKQLFNLAGAEIGLGHSIKYLVLLTCDLKDEPFSNKAIVIDYDRYKSFGQWKEERYYADEIPVRYGRAVKKPYIKGGEKDLVRNYSGATFQSIQKNLHNVLWGGGGTDDNEVFSSLVNIILAKIQDESEKEDGEEYDFQSRAYIDNNGDQYETNEQLFERMNDLYRRALRQRLYITDDTKLAKSYIIDENKFSLSKLKYAVMSLERYSLVDGKNSYDGKDILGDFFEGIIRDGFKQSKGQFFTHTNIVTFILWALQLDKLAIKRINKDKEIPYLIDPSAGSGTFLIEYMQFITENVKRRFRDKISHSRDVKDKIESDWFYPDHRENRWAQTFIYGIEHNFNLGTASKVNMILHGDGSTNIFVKDGLLPFNFYTKETAPNALIISKVDDNYAGKNVNGQFDVVVSNPPFSVDLDNDTKTTLSDSFLFGDKRNSENLFIERYYHLLREGGRMGIILPESVFDTTENKYIRLFIYKYFIIKAVVSLPQVTFAPYTPTKTSILFAKKKTASEIDSWNNLWNKKTREYGKLKTRCVNLCSVADGKKQKAKLKSIKDLTVEEERTCLLQLLRNLIPQRDRELSVNEIILKYRTQIDEVCKVDNDTRGTFGVVNTWWVMGEVVKQLSYPIFMAEAEHVGYKRTKRSEQKRPNDLYRVDNNGVVLVDDGIKETVLDYIRDINWED